LPPSDPAVHVAVFVSTLSLTFGDGTTQGLSVLGRVGQLQQTLVFTLPGQFDPACGLWWQPADRDGFLHLQALRLVDAAGSVRARWQAGDEGALAALQQCARQQIEFAAEHATGVRLLLAGGQAGLRLPLALDGSTQDSGPWRLEVDCGWPLSADYRALADTLAPGLRLPRDETVEIIVPVYGGLPHLRRCVTSVLGSLGRQRWHLTVIDDASPDPDVAHWLRKLAALYPQVSVISNARNLGFVGTANLGLRLAGRRDVVLLNSDTEVAGDWLDRLRAAAWRGARTGTVTPFSNNATICSFPHFCQANELPAGHSTASLQALFARTLDGQQVEIPTAVGFCMYIRRDCLDDVGEFDAAAFGAGYGEENDFCLRATARRWQHLHALDVFVYHAGGVSFNERQQALQAQALAAMRRLHPDYEDRVREFVSQDPARPYREAVMRSLV
jgi:GT2 family glycosyltransferase